MWSFGRARAKDPAGGQGAREQRGVPAELDLRAVRGSGSARTRVGWGGVRVLAGMPASIDTVEVNSCHIRCE